MRIKVNEMREYYWLARGTLLWTLSIDNKRVLCARVIKSIAIKYERRGRANVSDTQRCQTIRTITAAYRFERNCAVRIATRSLQLPKESLSFARKHETTLDRRTILAAIQLLDNSEDIKLLKSWKPYDSV